MILLLLLVFGFSGFSGFSGISAARQQNAANREVRLRLVDGLTGRPVPRVRYSLTGSALQDGLTGSADAEGNLVISELPAGRYKLNLEKAGYFPVPFDVDPASDSSPAIPEIVMTAKREISGTVRWQDGEPAARAQIRLMTIRGGKLANRNESSGTTTDDRGEFSVTNLKPGRYILGVMPSTVTGGRDAVGRVVAGGVPRLGVPVFYPGVIVPDPRSVIDVRGVVRMDNIGVIIEERQGTTVEGTVVVSASAAKGTPVSLTLSSPGGLYSVSTNVPAGEAFRLGPVPAGGYVLEAQSTGTQRGRILQQIGVGSSPVKDLAVSIPSPTPLTGQVEIDNPDVRITGSIRLQSENVPRTFFGNVANGSFQVQGIGLGESLTMTVVSIPANSYVASVSQGSQESTAAPFPIIGGGDPVRIVLKTDGGAIKGVATQNGRGFAKAFVVLAPTDRKLEQNFRTSTSSDDGSFQISTIAPGEYDMFAFDRNEDDDYLDEAFLREMTGRESHVTVAPRSTQSVEVGLQNIPRR